MKKRSHRLFHVALMLGASLCLGSPSRAADRPNLSAKTEAIEASVTIDDALKAYPGLYGNLLADGRREMTKWRTEAETDRKDNPDLFKEGRRYSFERGYTQRSAVGRYVSIVRTDYSYSGGAHPNTVIDTILWDADAKKRISIRPFFKETADDGPTLRALAKEIRAALAVEKKARDMPVDDPDKDTWLASVKPKLLEIGAVALAPSTEAGKSSGLISYFSPYAVGAYVEGSYTAFVPWAEFKPFLTPEGAALFGGERPKGDGEKD